MERTLNKKRGWIGYNPTDVRRAMDSLQKQHHQELERLQQEIAAEKERNQRLKADLDAIKQPPKEKDRMDDAAARLKEQFIQQTKVVLALKLEFEEKESILADHLEEKRKQREFVRKQIEDAMDYLKKQKNELKKELIQ